MHDPISEPSEFDDHRRGARHRSVHEKVKSSFARHAIDGDQRRLFELALPILAERIDDSAFCPCIDLPLLTYSAAGGSEHDMMPLSVAMTILELSMDLFDRVWDVETARTWPGVDPRLIEITGAMLMSGVVPRVIATLPLSPERIAAIHAVVATRLLRIAAGELRDLRTFGRSDVTLEEVSAATRGKTGERRALYAVVGAMSAGAPPETVSAYEEMALQYGYARQIRSDLMDLFATKLSRDLASGSRTWPLAWMLSQMPVDERDAFGELLTKASTDASAIPTVREILLKHGAVLRSRFEIERACRFAGIALERAAPREPAATELRAMLEAVSLESEDSIARNEPS